MKARPCGKISACRGRKTASLNVEAPRLPRMIEGAFSVLLVEPDSSL
jgi:hypothetical protein